MLSRQFSALGSFGSIADLHAWFKAFDDINTLSDMLPIKKRSIRSPEDKSQVASRKQARQANLKKRSLVWLSMFLSVAVLEISTSHPRHAGGRQRQPLKKERFNVYGLETAGLGAAL